MHGKKPSASKLLFSKKATRARAPGALWLSFLQVGNKSFEVLRKIVGLGDSVTSIPNVLGQGGLQI
jgi:hypothetical protein